MASIVQGEKNLGAHNGLTAGGNATLSLRGMEPGSIRYFVVEIFLSLISAAAAFNIEVLSGASAAAVGVDDLDAILIGMFSSMSLQIEGETFQYGPIDPRFLRRILNYFNNRDVNMYPGNGTSIPVSTGSAKAFKISMVVPEDLSDLLVDGSIFQQGSARLEGGQFFWQLGSSLTPTLTLANGSAVVSAFGMNVRAAYGSGSAGDVGPLWQAFTANVNNVWTFEDGQPRLGLFDQLSPTSNPGTGITINETSNTDVQTLQARYAQDRLQGGQYDLTQSWTPYLHIKPGETFAEWLIKAQRRTRIEITQGVSNENVVDIRVKGKTNDVIQTVSAKVAGGPTNPVWSAPILPSRMSSGSGIGPVAANYLGTRVGAGSPPVVSTAKGMMAAGVAHRNTASLVAFHSQVQAHAGQQKANAILQRKG